MMASLRTTTIAGITAALVALVLVGGCGTNPCAGDSAKSATPECLVSQNAEIDLVVIDKTAYARGDIIPDVKDSELGDQIGTVDRTGVTDDFQDWDATALPVGTEIYSSPSSTTEVIVRTDDGYVQYLKMVEG